MSDRIGQNISAPCRGLIVLLAWLAVCWADSLPAQSNLRLGGQVFDALSGAPLAGANVQVQHTIFGAVSGEDGSFEIENLPPGAYTVIFSMIGYEQSQTSPVIITEDTPKRISAALRPAVLTGDSVIVIADRYVNGAALEGEKIILTAENIARYRGLGIAQLLHQVAGVQVESGGGGSSRAIIRIHGSRASQVLVLLDGQRLNSPQTGEVDLGEIPLEQIDRIEIIPQGNSAIFGGSAFGGVVSFYTRQARDASRAALRWQGGSFSTARGSLAGDLAWKRIGLLGSYSQDYSRQNFPYTYEGSTFERENAWYRNRKAFARLSLQTSRHEVNLRWSYRRGEQGLPSSFYNEMLHHNAFMESVSRSWQLRYRWLAGSAGFLEASLAYQDLNQWYNNRQDPSPFTRYHSELRNGLLEGKATAHYRPLAFLEARAGFQYLEESLEQRNLLYPALSAGKKQRPVLGGFGGLELELPVFKTVFKTLSLRSALRYERYFEHPGEWYPLLGATVVPAWLPALSLSAGWARAVRYPDFNSLFWKGDARARGNPDLQPERKSLRNFGARFRPSQANLPGLSFYYYSEKISDLIFWHRGVNGVWEPRNEGRAEKRGWDAQLEQTLIPKHLSLQASYSRLEARNKSEQANLRGKRIVFTPRHTANVSAWLGVRQWQALLVYRFVSEREVVAANTGVPLAAYRLWDASLSWRHSAGKFAAEWSFAVKNITAADYELLRGYPMPGREFQISVNLEYQMPKIR